VILPPFELHRPSTLEEALEVRRALGPDSRWLAGGTQLLVALKYGEAPPASDLVDLKRVAELQAVGEGEGGSLRIGAGATYDAIAGHPDVHRLSPPLARLVSRIGNPRVRSAGTLGGNLGVADPRSDPMTLLVALQADVGIASAGAGRRRLPAAEFVPGPFATALRDGEVVTDVQVPARVPGAYLKFQVSGRIALGLAVAGRIERGAFAEPPRVVVGAAVMAPTPCPEAAALLVDRPLAADDPGVLRAAEVAAGEVDPYADPFASSAFKRRLVRAFLPRAVERMALDEAA